MLLALPILLPLLTAIAQMLAWRRDHQRKLAVLGALALAITAGVLLQRVATQGIQVLHVGSWPAPFGIALVCDLTSALMVGVTALVGLASVLYSLGNIDAARERFGYHPLLSLLLMGVCGAFLTGDLFNLYVWFEIMLLSSFVMMVLGGERAQLEGGIKYVTLSLLSSMLFLTALGLIYGLLGTLNMAELSLRAAVSTRPDLVAAVGVLLMVAFGIKAAAFPLFFWLPASYHTPPPAVAALFAGLLTKVGVYALFRVFTLIFVGDVALTHHTLLLGIAGFTMLSGVLGAVAQGEVRRVLSFHIVSQIGYMLLGLALYTPLALAGAVFYIVHHIIVKTNLFLIAGLLERIAGHGRLKYLGGFNTSHPALALLFLVPALSLAGLPPLSGFWAKLVVIRAAFEIEHYFIAAVGLLVGLLTLFSMMKIWNEAFWKPQPAAPEGAVPPPALSPAAWVLHVLPIVMLAACTLAIGLAIGPCFAVAEQAAAQLLDRAGYIRAVLGPGVLP